MHHASKFTFVKTAIFTTRCHCCTAIRHRGTDGSRQQHHFIRQLVRIMSYDNYEAILNSISILEHHYDKETKENKERFKKSLEALRLAFLSRQKSKNTKTATLTQRLIDTSARLAVNEILISMPWRWRGSSIFNLGTEAIGIGLFVDASFVSAAYRYTIIQFTP